MKVFICWSGDRSKALALALRSWLPMVIQRTDVFMSEEDTPAGARWFSTISRELEKTSVGIVCMTPENLESPWLHFEAGMIAKDLAEARVCPLLLDMPQIQLKRPLSDYQWGQANIEGIGKILSSINDVLGKEAFSSGDLQKVIKKWWPDLEAEIEDAQKIPHSQTKKPTTEEMLEELVANSRILLRGKREKELAELAELEKKPGYTSSWENAQGSARRARGEMAERREKSIMDAVEILGRNDQAMREIVEKIESLDRRIRGAAEKAESHDRAMREAAERGASLIRTETKG